MPQKIFMMKKLLEHFTKENCKKQIKQSLELKKQSREKEKKYMSDGKTDNSFNSWINKKDSIYERIFFLGGM